MGDLSSRVASAKRCLNTLSASQETCVGFLSVRTDSLHAFPAVAIGYARVSTKDRASGARMHAIT